MIRDFIKYDIFYNLCYVLFSSTMLIMILIRLAIFDLNIHCIICNIQTSIENYLFSYKKELRHKILR